MSKVIANQSGSVTAGAASVPVAGRNLGRREITVTNDHATQVAYLALATSDSAPTAVLNSGIRLNAAGGSWTTNTFEGAVAAIATGAATVLTVVEW